ncbi:hypothetical protein D3C71_1799180 [compost metagenome]
MGESRSMGFTWRHARTADFAAWSSPIALLHPAADCSATPAILSIDATTRAMDRCRRRAFTVSRSMMPLGKAARICRRTSLRTVASGAPAFASGSVLRISHGDGWNAAITGPGTATNLNRRRL